MIWTFDDGLTIEPYQAERDNAEAMAMEALAPQGEAFRLSFRRSSFHRRAASFDDHALLVARKGGRLVGVYAVAFKDVLLCGEPMRAAFGFDMRVHPDHRRQGIASRLSDCMLERCAGRAELAYSWVVDDNRAVQAMIAAQSDTSPKVVGRYAYQVYPTYRELPSEHLPTEADPDEVFEAHRRIAGPFDFATDPRQGGDLSPRVSSWMVRDGADQAGCSVWDNHDILGEVVERIPTGLRVAGAVMRVVPFARLPHVPRPGEQLRSWYIYDAFASRPDLARDLYRHLAGVARAEGIDYLYIVHIDSQRPWVEAVRADLPRAFAPVIPYVLFAGWDREEPFPTLERVYVDIRDL